MLGQEVYGKRLYLILNSAVKRYLLQSWYWCMHIEYFLEYIILERCTCSIFNFSLVIILYRCEKIELSKWSRQQTVADDSQILEKHTGSRATMFSSLISQIRSLITEQGSLFPCLVIRKHLENYFQRHLSLSHTLLTQHPLLLLFYVQRKL